MIKTLTIKQKEKLDEFKQNLDGKITNNNPVNFKIIKKAIKKYCIFYGFDLPIQYWECDSPFQAQLLANYFSTQNVEYLIKNIYLQDNLILTEKFYSMFLNKIEKIKNMKKQYSYELYTILDRPTVNHIGYSNPLSILESLQCHGYILNKDIQKNTLEKNIDIKIINYINKKLQSDKEYSFYRLLHNNIQDAVGYSLNRINLRSIPPFSIAFWESWWIEKLLYCKNILGIDFNEKEMFYINFWKQITTNGDYIIGCNDHVFISKKFNEINFKKKYIEYCDGSKILINNYGI